MRSQLRRGHGHRLLSRCKHCDRAGLLGIPLHERLRFVLARVPATPLPIASQFNFQLQLRLSGLGLRRRDGHRVAIRFLIDVRHHHV